MSTFVQIYNSEPVRHTAAYYGHVGQGESRGTVTLKLNLLPGVNFVERKIADKAGILKPNYPGRSTVEVTDVKHVPVTTVLDMLNKSADIKALKLWRLSEDRDVVQFALDKKIAQRERALAGLPPIAAEGADDGDAE